MIRLLATIILTSALFYSVEGASGNLLDSAIKSESDALRWEAVEKIAGVVAFYNQTESAEACLGDRLHGGLGRIDEALVLAQLTVRSNVPSWVWRLSPVDNVNTVIRDQLRPEVQPVLGEVIQDLRKCFHTDNKS